MDDTVPALLDMIENKHAEFERKRAQMKEADKADREKKRLAGQLVRTSLAVSLSKCCCLNVAVYILLSICRCLYVAVYMYDTQAFIFWVISMLCFFSSL